MVVALAAEDVAYTYTQEINPDAGKQPAANTHRKTSPESGGRASADSISKIKPDIQSPSDGLFPRLKSKQDQLDALSVSVEWRLAFFERREASERRIVYFSNRVEGPDTQKDLIESARISYRPCGAIWREIVDKNL
jgi:hypothetical protein